MADNLDNNTQFTSASVSYGDNKHQTALHLAVEKNNPELVQLFLEKNADVNVCNLNGETPIFIAVKNRYFEIVRILLDKEAKLNLHSGEDGLLNYVAKKGDTEMLRLLWERFPDASFWDDQSKLALFYLIKHFNHTDWLRNFRITLKKAQQDLIWFVDNMLGKLCDITDIDEGGNTLLHLAAEKNLDMVIDHLITNYQDPNFYFKQNQNCDTFLHILLKNNDDEDKFIKIANMAFEKSSGLHSRNNAQGQTLLHLATAKNSVKIVKFLLNYYSD